MVSYQVWGGAEALAYHLLLQKAEAGSGHVAALSAMQWGSMYKLCKTWDLFFLKTQHIQPIGQIRRDQGKKHL